MDDWTAFCGAHRGLGRRLRWLHLRAAFGAWLLRSLSHGGCVLAPLVLVPVDDHTRP